MTRTLYLDCFCGISGDMTVGALMDAGADQAYLHSVAKSLLIEGASLQVEPVVKRGIKATQFRVIVDSQVRQPHRHLHHILEMIQEADLEDSPKSAAAATFQLLGQAEAEVHGIPVEKVHFHEVGAVDSILDIVLANAALHNLGVEKVFCSPMVVGKGTVICDHGVMPVPAPATALLLRGIPWRGGDVESELVTPTGAALARHWASDFMAMPEIKVQTVGYGAGTRDLPDRANVLRVLLGEGDEVLPPLESITILQTTIDDMNPEILAMLIPELLEAGARDAFVTPVMAKKGRMAQHLTVLADAGKAGELARLLFNHSTTLGVRVHEEKRWALERKISSVQTPWGRVRIKLGLLEGRKNSISPEFEDCRALAKVGAVPVKTVYEYALAAAVKGEYENE